MKRFIILLACIGMLFAFPVGTMAEEAIHFEENHTDLPLEKYGISVDLPGDWGIQVYEDKDTYAMFPTKGPDVVMMLQFVEHDFTGSTQKLDETLMVMGAESSIKGISGLEEVEAPEIYKLSNGGKAAMTVGGNDDHIFIGTCTRCGDYLVLLGLKAEIEKYEKEYADDMTAILASLKEI